MLCSSGVLIYGGIGLLCLLLGGNFLDYKELDIFLKVGAPQARSLGILGVEVGVGVAVMACMISIFYDIATAGDFPDNDQPVNTEESITSPGENK